MELDDKVVVVTGAGSGIGRASALRLARAGAAAVAVADVDDRGAEETVAMVRGLGVKAEYMRTDVGDPAQIENLFAAAMGTFGGVDVVHNNAGVVSGDPPWPGTSLAAAQRVIQTNLGGVVYGTRVAIDALRARGGGVIVNTASVAGLAPFLEDAVYGATKAAVIMFTRSNAGLLDLCNVRVNAVCPGIVDTGMVAKTGDGTNPANWLAMALMMIDMVTPEQVAEAVLTLVRDDTAAGEYALIENPLSEQGRTFLLSEVGQSFLGSEQGKAFAESDQGRSLLAGLDGPSG